MRASAPAFLVALLQFRLPQSLRPSACRGLARKPTVKHLTVARRCQSRDGADQCHLTENTAIPDRLIICILHVNDRRSRAADLRWLVACRWPNGRL